MRIRLVSPVALLLILAASVCHGQSLKTEWSRCAGASSDDYFFSVAQTTDGGYIACGYSKSDDAPLHHPSGEDAYVVKFDANGNIQWQKCYGGSANEEAFQIIQTMDGGYAVAICTESNGDGDVPSHPVGARDAWIVKLNDTGKIMWSKTYGGLNWDQPEGIVERPDSSLIFCGYNRSPAGETSGHHGGLIENDDGWLVHLNSPSTANNWERFFGGTRTDQFHTMIQTRDGGLIAVGETSSLDGDLSGAERPDTFTNLWASKFDAGGNLQWSKQFGGSDEDWANSVVQTPDGGYVIAGAEFSENSGDVSGGHGGGDGWVIKLDSAGKLLWQNCIGGPQRDGIRSIVQDVDGGFTGVGTTLSYIDSGGHGSYDGWILKLDAQGHKLWQKIVGGSNVDILRNVIHTNDGAYVAVGESLSKDFDIDSAHTGFDGWILKFRIESSGVAERPASLPCLITSDGRSVTIQLAQEYPNAYVRVSNILGSTAFERSLAGQDGTSIDASHLPAGTYFVTVSNGNASMTRAVQLE
jgi:hypothetical protein